MLGSGTYACVFMDSGRHFNPPTPWGVGHRQHRHAVDCGHFNPPTPWGVGRREGNIDGKSKNFNPPTPWGVGPSAPVAHTGAENFNPPTPWGVGLPSRSAMHHNPIFQSTHSVGSGTQRPEGRADEGTISIHPLRGEWDLTADRPRGCRKKISIHPLRGEWDIYTWTAATVQKISIHPLRGEWDGIVNRFC